MLYVDAFYFTATELKEFNPELLQTNKSSLSSVSPEHADYISSRKVINLEESLYKIMKLNIST